MKINKVTYIVAKDIFSPQTGGEIITRELILGMRNYGVVVDVVTLYDIPIHRRYNFLMANFNFIHKFMKKKVKNEIIIEDFYMHPWLFIFNWFVKIFLGNKIVIHVQLLYHLQQKNQLRKILDYIVSSLFLYPADIVISLSNDLSSRVQKMVLLKSRLKFKVNYPGCNVSSEKFKRINVKTKCNNKVNLLCISSFERRKEIHALLEAIFKLKKEVTSLPDFTLRIIGNSKGNEVYFNSLKEYIGKNKMNEQIILSGWQDKDSIVELYSISDIFIFPSANEGFGMVLAEAMFFGLPIIASKLGVVNELVQDGLNGILVPLQDVEGLSIAILKLIHDKRMRKRMGEIGRSLAKTIIPSWSESVQSFLGILSGLDSGQYGYN